MTEVCPACDSTSLEGFHVLDGVPTNSCLLLDDETEARAFPRGRLDLAVCHDCGFVTNRAFDADRAEYSARYEETQAFSPTFVDFGRRLAKSWVGEHALHGKHVLEIGCGKGEFLTWMIEAGAGSGTGIDPGVHPERLSGEAASRIDWIADFYDERYAHLEADAIVCRHTLEHIHPVGDFLRTLRANLGDSGTVVLFELPDTLRVLREAAFWDVYYEHCSYFTLDSLERLFHHCGFEVLSGSYEYDDQYLLIEAVPAPRSGRSNASDRARDEVVALARRFGHAVEETVRGWEARLRAVKQEGGHVALWGGGSKAVALLSALGDPSLVDVVVDINPHKQGKFIAGTGHLVLSPGGLVEVAPELVVAMNPIYLDDIRSDLDALGLGETGLVAV